MDYLNVCQARVKFNFKYQNEYTLSEITELLLTSNTDRRVNYGCNLKWKLTDKNECVLATGASCSTQKVSKPLG